MERGQREAVPRHDPIPAASGNARARFTRALRVLALLSVAIGALSAAIIWQAVEGLHIHMLIATALGTGFMVLVGGGLMTLVFMSASTGHDSEAARPPQQEND